MINDRDEEATWQREERPIAREISTVDLDLSGGVRGKIEFTGCDIISTVDHDEL